MRTLALATVAVFAFTAPALAAVKPTFVAKLAAPLATPKNNVIAASVVWDCVGNTCTAKMDSKKPSARDCADLAAQVGALTAYGTGEKVLDEAKLTQCNTKAKKA